MTAQGLHEHEARKIGKDIRVATTNMTRVARALEADETRGMMKAVVDADTDKILGFTCLGIEGKSSLTPPLSLPTLVLVYQAERS